MKEEERMEEEGGEGEKGERKERGGKDNLVYATLRSHWTSENKYNIHPLQYNRYMYTRVLNR